MIRTLKHSDDPSVSVPTCPELDSIRVHERYNVRRADAARVDAVGREGAEVVLQKRREEGKRRGEGDTAEAEEGIEENCSEM